METGGCARAMVERRDAPAELGSYAMTTTTNCTFIVYNNCKVNVLHMQGLRQIELHSSTLQLVSVYLAALQHHISTNSAHEQRPDFTFLFFPR